MNNRSQIQKELINLSIPTFLTLLLNYGFCDINSFYISQASLYFSIIVTYLAYIFITSIVKKTHLTTYILSIFILIFSIVNNIKLAYLNEPIYTTDIYFLNNIGELTNLVKNDILSNINYMQIIILFGLLFALCFVSKKYTMNISNKKLRITLCITSLFFILFTFSNIGIKNNFLLNKMYKVNERKDYAAMITAKQYYNQYGVIAGMYGLYLEDNSDVPEEYDKEKIEQLLNSFETQDLKAENKVKPNIIVMFQESYWDIEKIDEVEFNTHITENIEKLKQKGEYVKMLSPSYGGVSSNIVFELLTGGNLTYFRTGYDPYTQLYRKISDKQKPSLAKELKNNGYKTKVVEGLDYFQSDNIYKQMGIDQFINAINDIDNYDNKLKGEFISDKALVDDVINCLRTKEANEQIFYMVATMENHMPYYKEKYDTYDINIISSKLSEYENGIILSYAQGVYDTNIEIKRLYDEIQNIDEPSIVIFLGDHLPYLSNENGEDILQKTTYFNTGNEKQDILRKYTTDILILSNYDDNINIDTEYISPDLLLTTVVNNIDIELSAFYKYLYSTRNILPAQNQYLLIDSNSNIYYKEETVSNGIDNVRKLRKNLQYYLFKDSSN